MLRSSNCVLTGKTPMEFAKLNECPLDPGMHKKNHTHTEREQIIPVCYHNHNSLTLLCRGIFYRERSGESHTDPRAAVKESNHCGSGQEGCSGSLGYEVLLRPSQICAEKVFCVCLLRIFEKYNGINSN